MTPDQENALRRATQIRDNDLRVRVIMAVAADNMDELWAAREHANVTNEISVGDWDLTLEVLELMGADV
jgi:hypothetical protein